MLVLKPKKGESLLIEGLPRHDGSFQIISVTDHENKVQYSFSLETPEEKEGYAIHHVPTIEVIAYATILDIKSTGSFQLPAALLAPVPFSFDKVYLRMIFKTLVATDKNSELGLINDIEDPAILGF